MVNADFWKGRRVFLTGHTGFKGSWLSIWLHSLGAKVVGYALKPPTKPSLYALGQVDGLLKSHIADIRDASTLARTMRAEKPEVVFHLAAQSLVRQSYKTPLDTYSTNVMGTANLLEAARQCPGVRAVVIVTTDKCYENREWAWPYRENEPLGGHDPYSSSKACAELVTAAYRSSFFKHKPGIASARAGNVIGGGDWATDRLVPDCIQALLKGKPVLIRNPLAIRPWQHVLDPLSGYLVLAEKLYKSGPKFSQAWNFGPMSSNAKPVGWIVKEICRQWGDNATHRIDQRRHPHEARCLKLDCSKARSLLGWQSRWDLNKAIAMTITWAKSYAAREDLRNVCLSQIDAYLHDVQRI